MKQAKTLLIEGPILQGLVLFSLPMILGNLLQQFYNIADTLVVGRFLGLEALGAVGSAFSLMVFLTSILLGLCMGSGVLFSFYYGRKQAKMLEESLRAAAFLCAVVSALLLAGSLTVLPFLSGWLHLPQETAVLFTDYIQIVFWGIPFTAAYNYFAAVLRAFSDSKTPLIFLAFSAVLNIALDLLFVITFRQGIAGTAWATLIAQMLSGILIGLWCWKKNRTLKKAFSSFTLSKGSIQEVASYSLMTCLQQSVMNLGILMVQSLVNSFGNTVMAAFTAAVKIEAFAYMPLQEFGNAFSTFTAQNYGAGKIERMLKGRKQSFLLVFGSSLLISALILLFSRQLLELFILPEETEVLAQGMRYLYIVAPFYWGISFLFLFYAWFRAAGRPGVSLFLTILSLGSRVALAWILSSIPALSVSGIWWSVDIGWMLADAAGLILMQTGSGKPGKAVLSESA